jgi:four helix bundle protein
VETFENLECYKAAREYRRMISRFVKTLPRTEEYRLKDQLLRSSRGVTACIAEGYGRSEYSENLRRCLKSRGYLSESLDHLSVASDEGYMTEETYAAMCARLEDTWKILNGHIVYLEQCVRDGVSLTDRQLEN